MTVTAGNSKKAAAKAAAASAKPAKTPHDYMAPYKSLWAHSDIDKDPHIELEPVYAEDAYTPAFIQRYLLDGAPDLEAMLTPLEITNLCSRFYRVYHRWCGRTRDGEYGLSDTPRAALWPIIDPTLERVSGFLLFVGESSRSIRLGFR